MDEDIKKMTTRFFLTTISLAIIAMMTAVWSLDYMASLEKTGGSTASQAELTGRQNTAGGPKLSLILEDRDEPNFQLGENFTVAVVIYPENQSVQAADALLTFDKDKLKIINISPIEYGEALPLEYPQYTYNNETGTAAVSVVATGKPITDSATDIAHLIFQAVQPGETTIGFDFEPGKSTDSNLVLENQTQDALTAVENLNLTIAEIQAE